MAANYILYISIKIGLANFIFELLIQNNFYPNEFSEDNLNAYKSV